MIHRLSARTGCGRPAYSFSLSESESLITTKPPSTSSSTLSLRGYVSNTSYTHSGSLLLRLLEADWLSWVVVERWAVALAGGGGALVAPLAAAGNLRRLVPEPKLAVDGLTLSLVVAGCVGISRLRWFLGIDRLGVVWQLFGIRPSPHLCHGHPRFHLCLGLPVEAWFGIEFILKIETLSEQIGYRPPVSWKHHGPWTL